jgi:hypothetical protein
MGTKFERLLTAMINDEEYPDNPPKTKMEIYLKACIDGVGTENLPMPVTRADTLLYLLAEDMADGNDVEFVPDDGTYPVYKGPYSVTPSPNEQVLSTAQKVLENDIKIKRIPYVEVSNNSGGTTVTIGNEV